MKERWRKTTALVFKYMHMCMRIYKNLKKSNNEQRKCLNSINAVVILICATIQKNTHTKEGEKKLYIECNMLDFKMCSVFVYNPILFSNSLETGTISNYYYKLYYFFFVTPEVIFYRKMTSTEYVRTEK